MTATDTHRAIDAVWRIESPKIIASLARMVRDVGLAEDLAQDALVAALEQWPESGIPNNAGAWLMAAAKHRAIDHFRRRKMLDRKHGELGHDLEERQQAFARDLEAAMDDDVGDAGRPPDVGIEGLIGLVDVRQQDQQLQNIAINFQLNSCEVVDHVPELPGHNPRPLDRSIDRI